MKAFRITVTFSDPYPKTKEYREEATKFDFACKKALAKFRKDFKGKRVDDFSLRCQDLGTTLSDPTDLRGAEAPRTQLIASHDKASADNAYLNHKLAGMFR